MSLSTNSNTLPFDAFCRFLEADFSALSCGQCPQISFQKSARNQFKIKSIVTYG
ncbi:hypothetical protein NEPTK9_000122 [Candidatus Neptunochlamydia vexilliferae]|uniref:Transposase n=1 Tax=Candidatus Neptunichlamydia vexilliferae TaxID=1651774 RepID=A0ABS0AWW5_9BACT|nr:hypothetical protein [Candidatus Neptunochlamydia vexilliferae]